MGALRLHQTQKTKSHNMKTVCHNMASPLERVQIQILNRVCTENTSALNLDAKHNYKRACKQIMCFYTSEKLIFLIVAFG